MQLIGMLDSPFVRRVAISMRLMDIAFEHRPISVFRHLDTFASVNPVVKVPTLICDNGVVLMDSSLILDYLDTLTAGEHSLLPADLARRQHALRVIGLALVAAEKAVQIVYETKLRPLEKQHEPWLERVRAQLASAWGLLEHELSTEPLTLAPPDQAGVSCAVAWRFTQEMLPELACASSYPLLSQWSREAEQHPAFIATPFES